MLEGYSPVYQAFLGTLMTWAFTAAGAALVFCLRGSQRKTLDASLGFAAGVMIAASFWSLLSPALELSSDSGRWGSKGEWSFIPVGFGFLLGALFVHYADKTLEFLGVQEPPAIALARATAGKLQDKKTDLPLGSNKMVASDGSHEHAGSLKWRRIMLLIVAITVHNIPEGLAVGVGFGAIKSSKSATFQNARNLAIGIGLQNFPEGLAVSLPLFGAGLSRWKSFMWGQLSGVVEPVAGIAGAALVSLASPILPYALAFAAGAMLYVVVDDIIPEAQQSGNGKLASWGAVIGFLVMMSLDVGLG